MLAELFLVKLSEIYCMQQVSAGTSIISEQLLYPVVDLCVLMFFVISLFFKVCCLHGVEGLENVFPLCQTQWQQIAPFEE